MNKLHNSNNRGMTLMELIVAVAVLAIMILGFGQIVGQAQRVVTVSQNNMRSNATAEAIAKVIRDDLNKITKNGFLCITSSSDSSSNSSPRLFFTTAGITNSRLHQLSGNASVCCYGLINNGTVPADGYGVIPSSRIMLREAWILLQGHGTSNPTDMVDYDLSDLQSMTRYKTGRTPGYSDTEDIDEFVTLLSQDSNIFPSSGVGVPPINGNEVNELWKVLTNDANGLEIMWTDGTVDGNNNLNWYGILFQDNTGGPGTNRTYTKKFGSTGASSLPSLEILPAGENEYKMSTTASNPGYRALWTHENQSTWPAAIRISFRLLDPTIDEELKKRSYKSNGKRYYTRYEVIVPIE